MRVGPEFGVVLRCLPAERVVAISLAERGPLLLTSGTEDHTVPLKVTKEVFGKYSKSTADTEFHVFEGKGHSLTIDHGWKDVADVALNWLATKGF
jgi:dipeptidyl aminopeptidase/acylaminoacyl peptidase